MQEGGKGRRTLHQYFGRAGTKCLTDWVLVPEALALHEDPGTREFYSLWNEPQKVLVESGFDLKRFAELVTERGMGDFPHRMLPRRGLAQAKL